MRFTCTIYLKNITTYMRQPVSPEIQVAATLYYLSDAGCMRKTANSFGIGKNTVSCIVQNVTEMIALSISWTKIL